MLRCSSPLLDVVAVHGTGRHGGVFGVTIFAGRRGTTVVAAPGYPESPRTGEPIDLSDVPDDVLIFHAGTSRSADGRLLTAGGRVFAITSVAGTFAEAQDRSRTGAERVRFDGRAFRGDIGWRELQRRAGAA